MQQFILLLNALSFKVLYICFIYLGQHIFGLIPFNSSNQSNRLITTLHSWVFFPQNCYPKVVNTQLSRMSVYALYFPFSGTIGPLNLFHHDPCAPLFICFIKTWLAMVDVEEQTRPEHLCQPHSTPLG